MDLSIRMIPPLANLKGTKITHDVAEIACREFATRLALFEAVAS